MVEEVATELEAQFPDWLYRPSKAPPNTQGTLYLSDLPDLPDAAVALYQYPGEMPDLRLGNHVAYEKPRLQVLVRNKSAALANTQSYQIMQFLNQINSQMFGGVYYVRIVSESSPAELGPDAAQRQRWTTNFAVHKYWSPT